MHRLAAALVVTALAPSLALAQPRHERDARQGHPEVSLGVFGAVPSDEIDDTVDTSVGVRLGGGFWLTEALALHVAARYLAVNAESDLVDVGYVDLAVGATVSGQLGGGADVYFQGEVVGARIEIEAGPFRIEDEDPGFAFRGGVRAPVAPRLALDVFLGFTQIFANDDSHGDSRWLDVGAGVVLAL